MTVKDTMAMIAGMTPELQPGLWVYCCLTDAGVIQSLAPKAFALIREAEGTTLILPADTARTHALAASPPMRLITLNVFSDLEGVGLTAAVATALADKGISCNVVAAFHHDHIFVPEDQAEPACAALLAAQRAAKS